MSIRLIRYAGYISRVMIPQGASSNNKKGSDRKGGEWPLPTKSSQMQCAVPNQGPGGLLFLSLLFRSQLNKHNALSVSISEQMNIIIGQQTAPLHSAHCIPAPLVPATMSSLWF